MSAKGACFVRRRTRIKWSSNSAGQTVRNIGEQCGDLPCGASTQKADDKLDAIQEACSDYVSSSDAEFRPDSATKGDDQFTDLGIRK